MMIDILDFEDNALLAISRCPNFLLVPEEIVETEEGARERLRMKGRAGVREDVVQDELADDEERDGSAGMGLASEM
eukprot:5487004-Heterocapsa_arctica.AAC.1